MLEPRQQVRQQLIALARRRQRRGSGSPPAFLKRRTALIPFPDLSSVLEPILWALVGGLATRLYMPERSTQDRDIAVGQEDGREVRRRLTAAGFQYQGELSIGGSSWLSPEDITVGLIERKEPWLVEALVQTQENRDPQGLPVLPLPYLVMMKFEAGRVQDLADLTRMLGQADAGMLSTVRQVFAQYLPEEMEDLESLIVLGQMEMRPPQDSQ